MAIDMELAKKGRKEPRMGIVEQLAVSIALAQKFAVELAPFGWTKADTDEAIATKAKLETGIAAQAEAKDVARNATVDQNKVLSTGKALKRNLDRAVRSVFRRKLNGNVTARAFEAGGPIGDSVPNLLAYFIKVQESVVNLAAPLKNRMGGIDPVTAIAAAKAEFEAANVTQELAIQDLPSDTLEIYEAKGKALLLLADLNDAGNSAFDGDANEAGKFNKDIIVRARKEREKKPVVP